MAAEATPLLKEGNMLCSSRELKIKMVKEVSKIYSKCKTILEVDHRQDTPLILAARLGLAHMVWGFIKCAKQPHTDFDTDFHEGLQSMLGKKNWSGNTALHVAAANSYVDEVNTKRNDDVVKVLLRNVSLVQLISCRNSNGKTPLSLLINRKYDENIFECLERARNTKIDEGTSIISFDDEQQDRRKSNTSFQQLPVDDDRKNWPPVDLVPSRQCGQYMHCTSRTYDIKTELEALHSGERHLDEHGNTVLHQAAKTGNGALVDAIIRTQFSLMYCFNKRGETPAFVAAKEGHLDIIRMMINGFREKKDNNILDCFTQEKDSSVLDCFTRKKEYNFIDCFTQNKEQNIEDDSEGMTNANYNPLHIAIKNHHAGVVFWLIKEVPGLVEEVNLSKASPLCIAAAEGQGEIVKLILENCKEENFKGPEGGRALYEAARNGSVECIRQLLSKNGDLLYEENNMQLTALDVAVSYCNVSAAKELLDRDCSRGYKRRSGLQEDGSTIHIAARIDCCEILEYLISKCPGCIDITNDRGMNILHFAIQHSSIKVIQFLFHQKSLSALINEKDNQGNTPIHLLVARAFHQSTSSFNLDICYYSEKPFKFDITKILMDHRVDLNAINNKSQKPIDMVSSNEERESLLQAISQRPKWEINKAYDSEEARKHFEMMDQIVIVVALTLTASFAAAFAVPGGFDGNEGSKQGMPVLLNTFAYKVFIVVNALAFICSCSVLIENVRTLIGRYAENGIYEDDMDRIVHRAFSMYALTGMAMVAMAIAFITGTYVILTPSIGFAISICSICASIFFGIIMLDMKFGALVYRIWNMRQSQVGDPYSLRLSPNQTKQQE